MPKTAPDMTHENARPGPVGGIDEAGRGPWAGPLVAAAVVLDPAAIPCGINDSKRLSPKRRALIHDLIRQQAACGIGIVSVDELAALRMTASVDLAMQRAVAMLPVRPRHLLIDGRRVPPGIGPAQAIVKGDGKSLSIAAASILAKVTRDRIMADLAIECPGYGWERNQGYGTAEHRKALLDHGITPHHRVWFRPIHKVLYEENNVRS